MKITKLIYIVVLGVLISSCNKYLDILPDNVASIDDAFVNRTSALRYLSTCYSYLPKFNSFSANPTLLGSDECYAPLNAPNFGGGTGNDRGSVLSYGGQGVSNPMYDYWDGADGGMDLYQGIRVCNIMIENTPTVGDLTEAEKMQWIAEAQILKAYYHFYLIRNYGAISIIDKNLPVYSTPDEVAINRNSVDECFDYVVRVIDENYEYLPLQIENRQEDMGRMTQSIALSIKARALITAASPLFNGNVDYANYVDKESNKILYSEYSLEKWKAAAEAAEQAIAMAEMQGHTLEFEYQTGEDVVDSVKHVMNLREHYVGRFNPSVIWGVRSVSGEQKYMMARLTKNDANANFTETVMPYVSPTLKMAETFYTNNGVPIDEDVNYDYTGRYQTKTGNDDHRYYIEKNQETAVLHFNREKRFYANVGFDRGTWYAQNQSSLKTPYYLHTRHSSEDPSENGSFYGNDYSYTGYFLKKLVHYNSTVYNKSFKAYQYAFPVIRLSDLYLYAAEAWNEYEGPSAKVYSNINKVRQAAYLEDVVESWNKYSKYPDKPNTQDGLRDIIHQERAIELAFEGARFWDVKRWKKANVEFSGVINGWSANESKAVDYYNVSIMSDRLVHETKDYLWPVKEYQLSINSNLTQNLGW